MQCVRKMKEVESLINRRVDFRCGLVNMGSMKEKKYGRRNLPKPESMG
jgi:hypothetical protein